VNGQGEDNPTRDERASRYALGLRDLSRGTPVEPRARRVVVTDDVSRSQFPSGSPMAGFRSTRAAAAGQHATLAVAASTMRGAILEWINLTHAVTLINWGPGAGALPLTAPADSPYRMNLAASIPGRSDPNSGLAFQGLVFAAGTGTPFDLVATDGTMPVGSFINTGARLEAGLHRLEWVMIPGLALIFAHVTAATAIDVSVFLRVPLLPSPLA